VSFTTSILWRKMQAVAVATHTYWEKLDDLLQLFLDRGGSVFSTVWVKTVTRFSLDASIILVTDQHKAQILFFIISLLYSSICFEHYVLIIWRSKCIIRQLVSSPSAGGRPNALVHRTATCWGWRYQMLYNTLWPPDDEHIVLETYRGI